MTGPDVVLASASPTRCALLAEAGVSFTVVPALIDETEIKTSMASAGASVTEAAVYLAHMKALRISQHHAGALVIGADQILAIEDTWFDKPADMAHAKNTLLALRGQTHALATAACICLNSERIWHHVETPKLTMRSFSNNFLDAYLQDVGESILSSVGAYRLEGTGVQLFSHIEGSFFTILGLPLLPLLDVLRANDVVTA